jgi:hypothetical protein
VVEALLTGMHTVGTDFRTLVVRVVLMAFLFGTGSAASDGDKAGRGGPEDAKQFSTVHDV